jgi:isopentenyl-diphosphate delta-isomerase
MEAVQVILVDEKDKPVGLAEKMEAHQLGLLHRAFSIFIFNSNGDMLLQRRALSKYHSGGLWTNACCSHPFPEEETDDAALRRLKEEMGFETKLEKVFEFYYKADFENGLIEHEYDHVLAGEYEGAIRINEEEVMDYCYKNIEAIRIDLQSHPEKYTAWFQIAFPKIEKWWIQHYSN